MHQILEDVQIIKLPTFLFFQSHNPQIHISLTRQRDEETNEEPKDYDIGRS